MSRSSGRGGQGGEVHRQGGVALGVDAHQPGAVGGGAGEHIHIDAGAQHTAVLVVGVVAADLGAARTAEEGGGGLRGGEELPEPVHGPDGPGAYAGQVGGVPAAVDPLQAGVVNAGQKLLRERLAGEHGSHSNPFSWLQYI